MREREQSDNRIDRPRKRTWHRPGKATLAATAAVLACGIIGVLLGAYLHEIQRPDTAQPATLHEHVQPPPSPSTSVTTLVVTVQPRQNTTGPAKTRRVRQQHTGAPSGPTSTPAPPTTSSSSSSPTPSTPPSSSSSAPSDTPSSTPDDRCGGLLGCLLGR